MSGVNPERSMFNEIQALYKKIEEMEKRHKEEVRSLRKRIVELEKRDAKNQKKIAKLESENERLRRALNNNSTNSSLPPSTDQKPSKGPNEYNSRKPSGLRPGGQVGHKGTTLSPSEIEKKIKQGALKRKVHISSRLKVEDRALGHFVKRYVVDLEVSPIVHEYHLPLAEASTMAPVSYGDNIKALAISLVTEHAVSLDRTVVFLNTITGNNIHLSHGTIDKFLTNFSKQSASTTANIAEALLNSAIVYTDATNISLNGTQSYIRNQSIDSAVLYSSQSKKNIETLKRTGILEQYGGMLVTDHETALYNFGSGHAECNAHLVRYLLKTLEEAKNSWAEEMIELLVSVNRKRKQKQAEGYDSFSPGEIQAYLEEYDRIIAKGQGQNKKTKRRYAKREEKALLTRLTDYKESYTRFMHDFNLDFTNNISERDLRKCKNKQKISGGFRSEGGKTRYCEIMSVIETCKRRNINTILGIKRILAGEVLFGR